MMLPLAFISLLSGTLLFLLLAAGAVLLVLYLRERDRHVQRTLRQDQMEAMFTRAHVALALVGKKNEIIECNETFAALFGRDAATFVGEPLSALVHPEEREAWANELAHAAVQRQREVASEQRYVRADGAAFRGRFRMVRATNAKGKHLFSTVTLEDVTQQRVVEKALRASEEKHRNLFEHAADAMLIVDPRSDQVIDANPRACAMYGIPREDFVGRGVATLLHEDAGDVVDAESASAAVHRGPEGQPMHLLINASLIPYGHADAVLSIHRDVTHFKQAEARLRDSERRYRRLVDVSPEPIMLCVDGEVRYANQAAHAFFGHPDLVHRRVPALLAPASHQRWAHLQADPTPTPFEAQIRHADGALVDVEVLADRVPFGEAEALHVVWRDNRARKAYERELVSAKESAEQGVRLRNGLFDRVSHDLRTPVSSILGFAQILEEEVHGSAREFVGYIRNGAYQLMHALDSLVDVSTLENGAAALHTEQLDVADVIDGVVAAYQPMAYAKGMAVAVEVAPGTCVAHFDRAALQRVFTNLVSNALKFNEQGCVRIGAAMGAGGMDLYVSESGTGLNGVVLPDVGEALEQALGTTHQRARLDLALARRLVEAHGGEISVQAEPGMGTAFRLHFGPDSLPFTAPQQALASEEAMLDELVVAHRRAA